MQHKSQFLLILLHFLTTSALAQRRCQSSLTQQDCSTGEVLVYDEKGCPVCQGGIHVCDNCDSDSCAPGLTCETFEGVKVCAFDKTTCHHAVHMANISWRPECMPDGSYAAKQCRGDKVSGRCFCFNAEGKRIFGWDWRSNEESMTCACSRRRSEMEQNGQASTLHCNRNGNYEGLQCSEGICWCAEADGSVVVDTRMVPENWKEFLPCYNRSEYGENYLRQCESIQHAQSLIATAFEIHGTKNVVHEIVNCDYDGSYGVNNIQGKQIECTWRDGKKIDVFYGILADLAKMDCTCARDLKIFESEGLSHRLACQSSGSYENVQHLGTSSYCVDSMGYSVTDYMNDPQPECEKYNYETIDTETYCTF